MADVTQPQPAQEPSLALSAEKIHVMVRNRFQILFNDDAKSVSSKNDTGIFDVLPEHANFISLISSPLTIRKMDGKTQEITFKNGLIKVRDNGVHCYVDLLSEGINK